MPDPVLFKPNDATIRVMPRALVYTKPRWTAAWTLQPHLIAVNCNFTINAVGTATLRYHYGAMIQRGDTKVTEVAPLELRDHWVKIICVPNDATIEAEWIKWYGIVTADTREHHGAAKAKASGDQIITAMSPEYILTRIQITHSRIRNDSQQYYIDRALSFNSGKSDRNGTRYIRGNKRTGHLAFAEDLTTAEVWNAKDIADYLMQFVVKQSQSDQYPVPLRDVNVSLDVDNNIVYLPSEVQADGRTVFDVMQQLWSRQRGLGWRFEFLGTQAMELGFALKVFSLSEQDVLLADGQSLPANPYAVIIDTSKANAITRNVTQIDQSRRYKQVIAEGGYFGSVFTVGYRYGNLDRDWTDQDETAYANAAKASPGYAALDLSAQRSLNDQFRTLEDYRFIYTSYKVPIDWDGTAAYEGLTRYVFPDFVQEVGPLEGPVIKANPADSSAPQNVWLHGMRFLPYIPMYAYVDYNDADPTPPVGDLPDFVRPFGVCKITHPTKSSKSVSWYPLDAIEAATALDETKHSDATETVSCSVRMQDHQLGVQVIPSGVSHKIANTTDVWQGFPNDRAESHVKKGVVDWKDIYVTVYAQSDKRVRYVYPPQPYLMEDDEGNQVPKDRACDLHSTLLIRVGDRARMDYLAPFTILSVTTGGEQLLLGGDIPSAGKLIRDDRPYLETLAKMAYAWHETERRSLSIDLRHLWGTIKVGMLINQLQHGRATVMATSEGDIPFVWEDGSGWLVDDVSNLLVNSVVSNLSYNFESGTTSITTAFAELQFE